MRATGFLGSAARARTVYFARSSRPHRLIDEFSYLDGVDPLFYEDAERRMVEYVGQALKQTSREATVLLCAPALDPHLQEMAELSD